MFSSKIKKHCIFHSSSHQVLFRYPCRWVMGRLLWYPGPVSPTSDEHKQEAHHCQHSKLRFKTALTLAKNRNMYPRTSAHLCGKETSFASKEFPTTAILPKATTAEVSLHHLLSVCGKFSLRALFILHQLHLTGSQLCCQNAYAHNCFHLGSTKHSTKANSVTDANLQQIR